MGSNPVIIAGNSTVDGSDGFGTEATFCGLSGITIDTSGNLYVVDGDTIRKLTKEVNGYRVSKIAGEWGQTGAENGTTGTEARFNKPIDIAVDDDVLYVSDSNNHVIRKLVPQTKNGETSYEVGVLAGFGGAPGSDDTAVGNPNAKFNMPNGICLIEGADSFKYLFVVDGGDGKKTIRKIKIADHVAVEVSTIKDSGGNNVSCSTGKICLDNQGNIYVTGYSTIQKFTPNLDGTGYKVTEIAGGSITGSDDGPGLQAKFNFIEGITVDKYGNLYTADTHNHKIRKLTGSGTNYTVSTIVEKLDLPHGITVGDGNLFVTFSSYVGKISLQ